MFSKKIKFLAHLQAELKTNNIFFEKFKFIAEVNSIVFKKFKFLAHIHAELKTNSIVFEKIKFIAKVNSIVFKKLKFLAHQSKEYCFQKKSNF